MRTARWKRWAARAALALALLALLVAVAGWLYLRASLAQLDGERQAPLLSGPVRVERDAWGVPLISGAERLDLAWATGFVHAQERFFQMDLLRRTAAGELAELFGPDAIDLDKEHRIHRFRARVDADLDAIVGAHRPQMQAYVDGVNAGLADLKASGEYQQILDKYLAAPETAGQTSFWELLTDSLPALMKGLGLTLFATALSIVIALILGVAFGFLKVSRRIVLRGIATTYVGIFRGTPLLVQAFFFYFGLPQLTGRPLDVLTAGVLTLSLNAGAYMTEIVRGGIQSVDPGQMEASRSLGLSYFKSMRKVVIPQAVKIMTPSFINQFVITLKDSSLLAVIGFAELTYQGQQIYASNFRTGETLLIVAALYFVVITLLIKLSNMLDKRFNK